MAKSTRAVLLLGSLLVAEGVLAQAAKGSLSGRLTNGSADPIPNAVVVLCNADENLWFLTSTDAHGSFDLTDLPPNQFEIEVLSPQWRRPTMVPGREQVWGYSPWSETVVLQPDQNLQRNIRLVGLTLQQRAPQTTLPCTPRRPFLTLGADGLARLFIEGPMPVYPQSGTASAVEGEVNLEAFMNRVGRVISLRLIISPWPPKIDPSLTKAAVEAIRSWRYNPPQVNFQRERLEFAGPILVQFSNRPNGQGT